MADMRLHIFAQPIVGGGTPLAVGSGIASKMSGNGSVTLSFFGDGAANQGSTHESMNLAAIWKLPVIFICENNQFAESTRASYSIAGGGVARRAAAYGIPGEVVDGMDVLAVHAAVQKCVERAKRGEGPSVLECLTYRFEGHDEGDNWDTYRSKDEVDEWKKRDPILNFTQYLSKVGVTSSEIESVNVEVEKTVNEAIKFAENSAPTNKEEAFRDVFADAHK